MADKQDTNPGAEAEAQAGADAPGSSEGGFSEAFAERAAPAKSDDQPSDNKAADTAAASETPADKAGASEAPSGKEGADATSGTGEKPDPWAGLTPEQLDLVKKLEQSDRSNRGRVGALTRQLNERLEGTRKPPEEKPEETRGTDEGETGGDDKKPTAESLEAKLKKIAEGEYGDIVGGLAEALGEVAKDISSLKASETRKQVDADTEALTEAYGRLADKHPDFRNYNAENEQFKAWFMEQPKGVQALVNSMDPDEVSLALQMFKTANGIETAKPTADDTTGAGKGGDGDTATGDRRKQQLDGLRDAPNAGAPASSGVPNDFSSAFNARATQKGQRAA